VHHRRDRSRVVVSIALWLFVLGNAAGILWIWGGGGGGGDHLGYHWHNLDAVLLGLGRITALLAGYLALIEVVLLAGCRFSSASSASTA
jgi:hypothetical protein